MPIYEYDCPACGRFEQIQKVSDPVLKSCPQCAEKGKKSAVQRAVSTAAFHLKGSGWYKTDYAASSANGSVKKSGGTASPTSSDSSSDSATTKTDKAESKASTDTTPKGGCGSGACGCH